MRRTGAAVQSIESALVAKFDHVAAKSRLFNYLESKGLFAKSVQHMQYPAQSTQVSSVHTGNVLTRGIKEER
jgi:hypothetical protein